jgi:hypothetical protein
VADRQTFKGTIVPFVIRTCTTTKLGMATTIKNKSMMLKMKMIILYLKSTIIGTSAEVVTYIGHTIFATLACDFNIRSTLNTLLKIQIDR